MEFMNLGEFTGANVYIELDVDRVNFENCLFLLFWPKFDRVLNERRNRTVEKYQVKLSLKERGDS
jgi:hypothetical protein